MAPGSLIFLMTLVFAPQVQGQMHQHVYSLFEHKFNNNVYNPRVRPVKNSSDVTVVSVGFRIDSIIDFNRGTGVLTFLEDVHFSWTDQFLTWDPDDYGGAKVIHVDPTRIWRPLVHPLTTRLNNHPVADVKGAVNVHHTGLVFWAPLNLNLHANCAEQSFDTLKCELQLASKIHPATELLFVLEENDMEATHDSRDDRWQILNTRVSTVNKTSMFLNRLYSAIQLDFTVKRILLLNERLGILPLIILAVLCMLLFSIPLQPGKKMFCASLITLVQGFLTKMSDLSRPGMRELAFFLIILSVCNSFVMSCLYMISGMSEEETASQKIVRTKANIPSPVTLKTLHTVEQNGGDFDVAATPNNVYDKMCRTICRKVYWIFIFTTYAFLIAMSYEMVYHTMF